VVKQLLNNGPVAVRQAKRLVFEVTRRTPEDALAYAVDEIARLRVSPEGQEGLAAFLEKREPQWK
jgi:methylglutaconyl-CoA hydratase